MDYHVRDRKGVVGIEKDDPGIPANRSGHNDNVFAEIQKTFSCVKIDRFREICCKSENIDRKQNGFDEGRKQKTIVRNKPIEVFSAGLSSKKASG